MDDYISREAAEQVVCEACERPGCPALWGDDCDSIDRLNTIPAADVVEVVRCKDCREHDTTGYETADFGYCRCLNREVQDCFYCAHGEKGETNAKD